MIKFDKKKVVIKGNQNDLMAQWHNGLSLEMRFINL